MLPGIDPCLAASLEATLKSLSNEVRADVADDNP